MIDYIRDNQDEIIAIVVRCQYFGTGIEFFTPHDFSQQLAYMNRPVGYRIQPHVHNEVFRGVKLTQEVLLIRSGSVEVDLYDNRRAYLQSVILGKGDVILLASGGHGLTMLEATEMIEVKQGPYTGDRDKVQFEPNQVKPIMRELTQTGSRV